MKTLAAALSVALLAACGSDSPPGPVFGGFTPQDQTAVVFPPVTCDIPFVGMTSISAVAVAFTSYADACAVLLQTEFCGTQKSSSVVIGVALSGHVGGGSIAPAGPGTYPYLASPPTGTFRAILADGAEVDASCASVPGGSVDSAGGQIVLASVSDTAVAGSVDLRFDDGTAFSHAVDAATCPVSVDLCALFQPCWDPACVDPAL